MYSNEMQICQTFEGKHEGQRDELRVLSAGIHFRHPLLGPKVTFQFAEIHFTFTILTAVFTNTFEFLHPKSHY